MLGIVVDQSADVFFPEEIGPVVAFMQVNEESPRCADRDCGKRGQKRMGEAAEQAPFPKQPRRQHQGRDRKSEKPLGQKGTGCRRPREQRKSCVIRYHRPVERDDRGGEKQRQQIVKHVERTDQVDLQEGEIDRRREDAGLRATAGRSGKSEYEKRGQSGCHGAWQAHRELVLAQQRDCGRIHPISKRWLLEISQSRQAGHDPIAGVQHLARDLRIARLVRHDERPLSQRQDVDDQPTEQH